MSDQILWDCHMHSSFSVDSSTPMEDMVLKSIQQGLTGICFTEHLDPDYPDTPEKIDFSLDIPAYYQKLQELAECRAAAEETLNGLYERWEELSTQIEEMQS